MFDVWKYKNQMEKYVKDKYGFSLVKIAKDVDENLLIFLCYYEKNIKCYRHDYTSKQINEILDLRELKLKRILDE